MFKKLNSFLKEYYKTFAQQNESVDEEKKQEREEKPMFKKLNSFLKEYYKTFA